MSEKQISRRTIAKGAAWSMPVVAAAVAAPSASASPLNPPCPDPGCATPVVRAATLSTGVGNPKQGSNTADLALIAGGFYASFLGCSGQLLQASIFTVTKSTLTMSDGSTYTTTAGLPVGVAAASQAVLATVGMTFKNVHFPDGDILSGILFAPVKPQQICFDYTLVLNILGSVPRTSKNCPGQVCFHFNLLTGSVYTVNRSVFGIPPNTVTYVTTGIF